MLTRAKSGKDKVSWVHAYRAPREEDDNSAEIAVRLTEKLLEWEALDFVPNERLPMETESWTHGNTPAQYGASDFRALFSARQLLCHGTSVEVFRELLAEAENRGELSPIRRAAFVYLTLSLDRLIDYNSRQVAWHPAREVIDHTFRQHAFPLKWSYAEMAPLVQGIGYDWSIRQTAKCIKELVQLARPPEAREAASELELSSRAWIAPHITLSCKSGDALDHVVDQSVDCVVMDPPYYDNVMYAELSDFFYVWLKRTAGHVLPELFRRPLTEKENEAVANPAKFRDQKGAKALAARDYQERMAAIFAECRRVLKSA